MIADHFGHNVSATGQGILNRWNLLIQEGLGQFGRALVARLLGQYQIGQPLQALFPGHAGLRPAFRFVRLV